MFVYLTMGLLQGRENDELKDQLKGAVKDVKHAAKDAKHAIKQAIK